MNEWIRDSDKCLLYQFILEILKEEIDFYSCHATLNFKSRLTGITKFAVCAYVLSYLQAREMGYIDR